MDEHSPFPGNRLTAAILMMIALLPFALALAGTDSVPQGRPVTGGKVLPPLAFYQYAVNLREVPATGTITAPFSFWNRGKKPLKITALDPSCGCLTPRLVDDRKSLLPGMSGTFEVQVQTAREAPGPHTYAVVVRYDDGQTHEETVTFRLSVPEKKVTVDPAELYFYQLKGEPMTQEFTVTDHRGENLRVTEAVCNNRQIAVKVGEQRAPESGRTSTTIRVQIPAKMPPGPQISAITLKTDDEEYPMIRVPVFVHGQTQGVQLTSGTAADAGETADSAGRADEASGDGGTTRRIYDAEP